MRNFFSKMLKGLVFIFLDINIVIDFLPDIIGYFIIAGALAKLPTTKGANTARWLALILGILSIFEMPIFQELWMNGTWWVPLVFNLIIGLLLLSYFYYIFKVCLDLLKNSPHVIYTKRMKYVLLTSTWLTLITPAANLHLTENGILALYTTVFVVSIIAFFAYVIYLYKMKMYAEVEEKRIVQIDAHELPQLNTSILE